MKILILPLDNRPVTYIFPQLVAQVAGVCTAAPPRHLMGSLNEPANIESLMNWVETILPQQAVEALLLCVDSVLYGGLINARRSQDSLQQILERVARIARWKKLAHKSLPICVQSSIMRISNNYDASEEKEYWAQYGREIFAWSQRLYKLAHGDSPEPNELQTIETKIPQAIRNDYLTSRHRNLQVSRQLVKDVESGTADVLILGLDDSGEFGLNVLEQERLMSEVTAKGLSQKVLCYPGSDEILCTLLARWLVSTAGRTPKARIEFSPEMASQVPSRYEGQKIGDTTHAQLTACGIELITDKSGTVDFVVIVHGPEKLQGDHICLSGEDNLQSINTRTSVSQTIQLLKSIEQPVVLCDVAYANGSDPWLVKELFNHQELIAKLWAYAGWNTTGNTIGSALSLATAKWFAESQSMNDSRQDQFLKKCLFTRFADDWAYQAQVRSSLESPVTPKLLETLMKPHLDTIAGALNYQSDSIKLSFPWNRTFEIEVDMGMEV